MNDCLYSFGRVDLFVLAFFAMNVFVELISCLIVDICFSKLCVFLITPKIIAFMFLVISILLLFQKRYGLRKF